MTLAQLAIRSNYSKSGGCECLEKLRAVLEAHDPGIRDFSSIAIEEDRSRRPEQAEALEQFAVVRIVRGDVRLQQRRALQSGLDRCVAEGEALHFLAGHAPVGVEIKHYRAAAGAQ